RCDELGHLIALTRMVTVCGRQPVFDRKAVVSAGTGLPSAEVEGIVDHPPTVYVAAQCVAGNPNPRRIADFPKWPNRRRLRRRRSVIPRARGGVCSRWDCQHPTV